MSGTTIYEVARKAGVSVESASGVLGQTPGIGEGVRKVVMAVASELNFKPVVIEIFFPWTNSKYTANNPWYANILEGVRTVSNECYFKVVTDALTLPYDPVKLDRQAVEHSAAGVLVISPLLQGKQVPLIAAGGLPVVFIGYRSEDPGADYVDSQNIQAMGSVVDHLSELGHRRIAFISGDANVNQNAMDRLVGFRMAMEKHRLAVPEGLTQYGDFWIDSGSKAMAKLLDLPERPTAVICANDFMAIGAAHAMEKAGIRVGRDIALTGFDDIPEASEPVLSLTTVRQDLQALSREAVKMLLDRIYHPEDWKSRHMLIPTKLIVRASSGSKI